VSFFLPTLIPTLTLPKGGDEKPTLILPKGGDEKPMNGDYSYRNSFWGMKVGILYYEKGWDETKNKRCIE